MRYLFIILFAISAFAAEDETNNLVETSQARRETWKIFRETVSAGSLCRPKDYVCFRNALSKVPGFHPEDLIAARSILEVFYLRSLKDDTLPCSVTCQNNMRAHHVSLFLSRFLAYDTNKLSIFNFKDTTTVRANRVRAYMDLSAYANIKEDLSYVRNEYEKIDFTKLTIGSTKKGFERAFWKIDSGKLFSNSVLCHLHPGDLIYDEIAKGKSKVDAKYRTWLKDFDENARKHCHDSSPIEYRGMDRSTREYYDRQTVAKLKAIDCKTGDYGCLRKHFRNIEIRYTKGMYRVMDFLQKFSLKEMTPQCDETCKAQNLLRATQTLITYVSKFDRQKLGSTMDWKKYPEAKFKTITEDVGFMLNLEFAFNEIIDELVKLDPRKITDEGLKSELKSISTDVSHFASGKILKDSVICTMEPWTAAYDKYMTPYKEAKRNKQFEKNFIQFKEKICK